MPTKSHSLSNTFPVDTYPKDPKRKIHTEFIKYCSPPLFFIVGRVGIEPTSRTLIWDPAALHPIELPSEMHHIPKGASYFRIARPLRFQVSHSTGFLVTNRRRIRLTSRVIYTNVHVNS